MTDGTRTLAIRIEGRVQGVSFRAFTCENAMRLGIEGWIANRDDGSVEGAMHGSGAALGELIALLRKGPPAAIVEKLDVQSAVRGRAAEVPEGAYRF